MLNTFFRQGLSSSRPLWRGHLLLFDPKPPPQYAAQSGIRLLLVFVLLEGVLGPRLSVLGLFSVPVPDPWLRVSFLLLLSLGLLRFLARVHPAELGLHSWAKWTETERWYFIQVLVIGNVIFSALLVQPLDTVWSHRSIWASALSMLLVSTTWGFYQELIYRGILQTELIRRWGSITGILVGNLLYTFGPLHFNHFEAARGHPENLWMFAAIFAIGLFFALLYKRSGNLWMAGIYHGIGNWYLVGLGQVAALAETP